MSSQVSGPLVSVVIPTRSRPQMLAAALASVRVQTFTDYEIIVVSNGESTEMRRASRQAAAGCIYFALDGGNVSMARNYGIEHARGDWIAFLDDDDLWLPAKLEQQIAEAKRTGADMIASDLVEFDPDGREVVQRPRLIEGRSYAQALTSREWWAVPSVVMIRRSVFSKTGCFDPRLRCNEDNDMWRRISWHHNIYQMDEVLTRYRTGHLRAMDPRFERMCCFYDLLYWLKMHRDTPPDLRCALLPAATFVLPRVAVIVLPKRCGRWLTGPHPWLRPRRRWNAFRRWLRA